MKTLIIAWIIALSLYAVTTVVMADEVAIVETVETADYIEVWTGFTEGNMCIMVEDHIDKSVASAELWLVTQDEVEWIRDLEGHSCIDVDVGEGSELHILTYDPRITVFATKDIPVTQSTLLSQL